MMMMMMIIVSEYLRQLCVGFSINELQCVLMVMAIQRVLNDVQSRGEGTCHPPLTGNFR